MGSITINDMAGGSIDNCAAGMSSNHLNTDFKRAIRVLKEEKRKYSEKDERTRNLHYESIQIKDQKFYNKTQNLWNEPSKLHPTKYARYSE